MNLKIALAAVLAFTVTAAAAEDRCAPQDGIVATVASVRDGRSLLLSDGREVRLAAIEVPLTMEVAAMAELGQRTAGGKIALSPLSPATDRYGRLVMLAFEAGDRNVSIDASMVARGLALAALRSDTPCSAMLKSAETSARRAKLGLWAKTENIGADNPAAILTGRGGFAIVEGKVLSVRESGGTIYLNFGRRWSEDFTATILKRNERKLIEAGVMPLKLTGRTVRIRGVIEERGGPWIEITAPEQIEMADRR